MAIALRSNSQISCPILSAGGFTATLAVRETGPTGTPKPRLLNQVHEAIRTRHYSRRTEKAYVHWVKRYIYREVLGVELPWLDDVVRAKRPRHLPSCLRVMRSVPSSSGSMACHASWRYSRPG